MDTTTFVSLVRNLVQVGDADEDITEDFILQQGYLALLERFTQPIIMQRNGSWLQRYDLTLTTGISLYRIPPRSITQGLEKFEIAINNLQNGSTTLYTLMNVLTNIQSTDYEGVTYNGRPVAFTYQADLIKIYPSPGSSFAAHIWYYLRPSTLTTAATTSLIITAIADNGNGTYRCTVASQAAFASSGICDLQLTKGNCEVFVIDAAFVKVSMSTTQLDITLTAEQASLVVANSTCINVGDATKYIQLPQEMTNALVSYTGAVVLAEKGDAEKAQIFTQKCETAIKNVVDIAMPRSKGQPPLFKTRNTYLRRRIGRWGYGGWGGAG
jgi:hypothetical protein